MGSGENKRRARRLPLNMLVQFRLDSMDEFYREYAANISVGGIFIKTLTPHPKGSMVYFQLSLGAGETLLEGLGRVVHINDSQSKMPGMGLEFVNLDEKSQVLIDRIMTERDC